MQINKNIKLLAHNTYHGSSIDTIEFELNGLIYFAQYNYYKDICEYGRSLNNEYYDTINTMLGRSEGMNNISIECKFGDMPIELFKAISQLKKA